MVVPSRNGFSYDPNAKTMDSVPFPGLSGGDEVSGAGPAQFTADVTAAMVTEAAKGPATRAGAERFALAFVEFATDARQPEAPSATWTGWFGTRSGDLAQVSANDLAVQRFIGTQRYLSRTHPAWISSTITGAEGKDDVRVDTSIVGYLVSEPMSFAAWSLARLTVVRHGGGWVVDTYAAGAGPTDGKRTGIMPAEERAQVFVGGGWREIVAASS